MREPIRQPLVEHHRQVVCNVRLGNGPSLVQVLRVLVVLPDTVAQLGHILQVARSLDA